MQTLSLLMGCVAFLSNALEGAKQWLGDGDKVLGFTVHFMETCLSLHFDLLLNEFRSLFPTLFMRTLSDYFDLDYYYDWAS